jgi:hypothetical protein
MLNKGCSVQDKRVHRSVSTLRKLLAGNILTGSNLWLKPIKNSDTREGFKARRRREEAPH